MSTDLAVPASALALAAHPDDVEFNCGATLARWASQGCIVHHLICTDGSKGTWNPSADLEQLVRVRQDEQRRAAQELGASGEVIFLGVVDGELVNDRATRSRVARIIRELMPESLLAHDPWKRYRLHPDHRAAGFLALDSLVAARDPHFFPEHGIEPHRPATLLLFEADEPDHLEASSEEWLGARCRALEAHESQWETTHLHRLDDPGAGIEAFRKRERSKMALAAEPFGASLGESFKLITEL